MFPPRFAMGSLPWPYKVHTIPLRCNGRLPNGLAAYAFGPLAPECTSISLSISALTVRTRFADLGKCTLFHPCLYFFADRSLLALGRLTSDNGKPSLLLIKLMKGRRRNADEEQAARQTPFQFIEFSCDQLAHSSSSFLCQTKNSRPIRDESHSFVFPPNFIYLSPSIP